ncbi:MAG: tail fiber domain-containing protein [Candidatus Poribacteria bacterium]|nr:tail fiber domain-containing protein [Candidatus Poribacteria bacterium]
MHTKTKIHRITFRTLLAFAILSGLLFPNNDSKAHPQNVEAVGKASVNHVTKFTTPGTISATGIVEVNDNFGIGTTEPENKVHIYGNVLQVESGGPALWLKESDQQSYRADYGYWRIIADHNALFFEVWENGNGKPGHEFDIQDEFMSFQRTQTTVPLANHIIQWNYDFYGQGVRDLNIGANWAQPSRPQKPRTLSLMSLDGEINELVYAMRIVPNNARPHVIFPNGNIGIGVRPPENILTVKRSSETDPIADGWTTYSSRRWKTHITPIEGALHKVEQLRGVSFDWREDGKHDIGLIAEEVGEVVPEVVAYEQNGRDAKSVDYARLVPLLVESIKEQQEVIRKQDAALTELSARIAKVEAALMDQQRIIEPLPEVEQQPARPFSGFLPHESN